MWSVSMNRPGRGQGGKGEAGGAAGGEEADADRRWLYEGKRPWRRTAGRVFRPGRRAQGWALCRGPGGFLQLSRMRVSPGT